MSRKKGVITSYIFMAVESLSSILFTPYLIRCLGQDEYGIYGLVASVTSYLYLLDMGVGNAIVRYMAKFRFNKDRQSEQNMMAITMMFYTCMALLVVIIGQILKAFVPNIFGIGLSPKQLLNAQKMLQITIFTAAFTLFFAPLSKTLIAYERFVLSKCLDIARVIIRVLLCCIALYFGGKGIAVVAVNLLLVVLSGLFCLLYMLFKLKIRPRFYKIERSFVREIFSYTFFIMLQMVATQINSMVNHILIGAMVASSAVILAVYTAATQITRYFENFASAINSVLMPGIVKIVEQKSETKYMENEMIKVSRFVFMFLGFIYVGFLVCGKQFMILWAGEDYANGYYVTLLIITPLLFSLTQSVGSQILWALNRHKVQALLKMCITICNILITVLLISWQPLIGAALGTAITLSLGDIVVMNIVFRKDIGISIKNYYSGIFKGVVPCLVIAGIAGALFSLLNISGWLGLLENILIICITYLIVMLIFGMNISEKRMLSKLPFFRKIIKL